MEYFTLNNGIKMPMAEPASSVRHTVPTIKNVMLI